MAWSVSAITHVHICGRARSGFCTCMYIDTNAMPHCAIQRGAKSTVIVWYVKYVLWLEANSLKFLPFVLIAMQNDC